MAAPTFVTEYESALNSDTTPKTQSVTVNTGDVLVVCGVTADSTTTLGTPSGGGLTYTLRQSVVVSSRCAVYAWTAVAASSQTFTLSISRSGSTGVFWGFNCLRFSASGGVGTSAAANAAGAAPTVNITATQANSAVVVVNGDWNAVDGTSRTWRTNAGTLTEQTYFRDTSHYTVYVGYHADAGTATTDAVGLSAPTGQNYSVIGVEVLGASGTNVTPGNGAATVAGHNPATAVTPTVGSPTAAVAAHNPIPAPSARPTDGTVTVTGQNPGTLVTSTSGVASGTLAAADPTVTLAPTVTGASGVVTGNNAAPSITPQAGGAALTVGALDAAVSTSGGTNATASEATVSASALDAVTTVGPVAVVGTATVTASNPAPAVVSPPATAGASVSALDASVSASASVDALAQAATVSIQAANAVSGVGVSALTATVDVQAPNAASGAGVPASLATLGVTAPNAVPGIDAHPATSAISVTGSDSTNGVTVPAVQTAGFSVSALDASVTVPGATNVNATVASVAMSALDATVMIGTRALEATLSAAAHVATGVITAFAEHAVITLAATDVSTTQRGGAMSSVDRTGPGMHSVDRTVASMRGS